MDQAGVICKQEGIFRINCMDCLDRTNVVQAAIARVVMEQQVRCFFFSKHLNCIAHIYCYYVEIIVTCIYMFPMRNHIYNIDICD